MQVSGVSELLCVAR